MTPNDNFKNALKAGKLADALVIALSKATELKITTSIVSANDYYGKNSQIHPEDCLETKINLLKGEINNKIGENLLKNQNYETLQKLHLEEAIQGNQIIQNNLETLQELFEILAQLKQQKLEITHPEIVSLHLGNQLPPAPPPPPPPPPPFPKISTIHKNPEIVVTENNPQTVEKADSKKRNRHRRYDWKTLTESMNESDEIPEITIETKDLLEEDWGDLIIDEDINSNQNIIEELSVKSKTVKNDTTLISGSKISELIAEENIAQSEMITNEDDMIEHISIEDDKINLTTQSISEGEVKSLRAKENKYNSSLNSKKTSTSPKKRMFDGNIDNYNLYPDSTPRENNEIHVMLPEEDWEDLLGDSEQLDTEDSELLDMPEVVSLHDSDDDWDDIIEELYEPKILPKNKK